MGGWEGSWKDRRLERREQERNGKCSGDWEGGGRKDGWGSREVYISSKGAIIGFARDLILEGFPVKIK